MDTSFKNALDRVFSLSDKLVALCAQAGDRVMEFYTIQSSGKQIDQSQKPDGTPITAADLAANHVLMSGLQILTPDWPIMSEENLDAANALNPKEPFWLVDPIDGTREFIAQNDEFAICLAAVIGGVPSFGIIYAPAIAGGTTWMTSAPDVAMKINKDGKRIKICARSIPTAPVILCSRFHNIGKRTAKLAKLLRSPPPVPIGAALKFCHIAEGNGDIYVRFGNTYEWDLAPGMAILQAAGGKTQTLQGDFCKFGQAPTFLGPAFYSHGMMPSKTESNDLEKTLYEHLQNCLLDH